MLLVDHDLRLVLLSLVLAALTAATFLHIGRGLTHHDAAGRHRWKALAALVTGVGVWSMHFVALLAVQWPVPINFELWPTVLSVAPVMAATWWSLRRMRQQAEAGLPLRGKALLQAGGVFGLGVGSMHYVGMAAIQLSPPLSYDPVTVALSVAVVVALGMLGLWLVDEHGGHRMHPVLGALALGGAIAAMHYTGMAATHVLPGAVCIARPMALPPAWMAGAITAGSVLVIGVTMLASILDRRLAIESTRRVQELQAANRDLQSRAEGLASEMTAGLRHADEMRRAVMHHSRISIFEIDLVQDRFQLEGNLLSSSVHEVGQQTFPMAEWMGRTHPGEREAVERRYREHLAGHSDLFEVQHRLRRQSGQWRWVLARGQVVERDVEGVPRRMIGTIVDVHDAKLNELEAQRERALFSQGPVVMVRMRVRPDHARWLYVSPNVRKCWGHDPEELMRMEDAFELLHPEDRQVMRDRFEEALRSNSLSVEFEGRIRLVSGDYRWHKYYTHLDPVTMERRGYIIDIHERKQAEMAAEVQGAELQRLVGQLRTAHHENEILQETGDLLHTTDRMDEAFDIIRVAGERLFEGWSGWVASTAEGTRLELRTTWGRGRSLNPPDFEERECWGLRRNRPHRYLHHGQHVCCGHLEAVEPERLRPYLCLPMVAHGETVGLMHLWADEGRAVDEADMALTEARATRLTETLKLALSNLRLRESLREQATRDALTGLHNRRFFDEALAAELARARRERRPVTLAMLDIDHFKRFNDTWGHEAGDEVLRAVARTLSAQARGYDICCRHGGEELALLLPGCDADAAVPKLEALREAIRGLKVKVGDRSLPPVTVSIGVSGTVDVTADVLMREADEALYEAKRRGRDRVCRFEAGGIAPAPRVTPPAADPAVTR